MEMQWGAFVSKMESRSRDGKDKRGKLLLGWWARNEFDTLCDVALQSLDAGLEEDLLAVIKLGERVQCLLGSGGLFRC